MYYEESKKKLMALLRQNGCPSVFLTLSCAEFDWPELLREIAETVYRRKFTDQEINDLSEMEKKKLISENVVQSTLHFQRRFEKLFALMGYDLFEDGNQCYHVSSYFFRVEFQQRGAPHVHSLLWLKDKKGIEAPNFWIDTKLTEVKDQEDQVKDNNIKKKQYEAKMNEIEVFADHLITTSADDIRCE